MPETTRQVTVARRPFRLRSGAIRRTMARVQPEPIKDHFVVVSGRRYPPKQVLSVVTGLERSEFTSHQALRVLGNLGFVEGRRDRQATNPRSRRSPAPRLVDARSATSRDRAADLPDRALADQLRWLN